MSTLLHLFPGDGWGFLIANTLIQATVAILAALLLARLGGRWNAAWRYSVYSVALVCVLASPAVSSLMQASGLTLLVLRPRENPVPRVEPVNLPTSVAPQVVQMETPAVSLVAAKPSHLQRESLQQESLPEKAAASSVSLVDVLRLLGGAGLVIWLFGTVWLLVRWCYGLYAVAMLRRSLSLNCELPEDLLSEVHMALGVSHLPRMATSADWDRPIMVGLIRPLVVLPENLLQPMHRAKLADILIHECAHAVCRHQAVGVLQRVAEMLFWPHPLIYRLNRELARAREEVCDNYVLRRSEAPRYARTLLELSQLLVDTSPKTAALGLFHCRWRLEDRIADLLDGRRRDMIRVSRWTTAALTAAFLLLAFGIAGTRVVQAAPDAEKNVEKNGEKKSAPAPAPAGETTDGRPVGKSSDGSLRWKVGGTVGFGGGVVTQRSGATGQPGPLFVLPGYGPLMRNRVVTQLNLTAKQVEKLREIQRKHFADQRQFFADLTAKNNDKNPPPQYQAEAYTHWLQGERGKVIRKQVEETLTPEQMQILNDILFREKAWSRLRDRNYWGKLGLTSEQEKQIDSLRDEEQDVRTRDFQETTAKMLAVLKPEQRALFREEALGPCGGVPCAQSTIEVEGEPEPIFVVDLHPYPNFSAKDVQDKLALNAAQRNQVQDILGDSSSVTEKLIREVLKLSPEERNDQPMMMGSAGFAMGASASGKLSAEEIKKQQADMAERVRNERKKARAEFEKLPSVRVTTELRKQFEAVLTTEQLTAYREMAVETIAQSRLSDAVMWDQIGADEQQQAEWGRMVDESIEKFQQTQYEWTGKLLQVLTPAQQEKLREEIDQAEAAAETKSGEKSATAPPAGDAGVTSKKPSLHRGTTTIVRRFPISSPSMYSKPGSDTAKVDVFFLPEYSVFMERPVVSELNLTADQKVQLHKIEKDRQTDFDRVSKESKDLPPDELQSALRRWRQDLQPKLRRQVEDVLTAEQAQIVKERVLIQAAYGRLSNPQLLENLDVTTQQSRKLALVNEEFSRQSKEDAQKAAEATLAVLNPQQRVQLREAALGPLGPRCYEELSISVDGATPVRAVSLHPYPDFSQERVQKELGLTADQQGQIREIVGQGSNLSKKLAEEMKILPPEEQNRQITDNKAWWYASTAKDETEYAQEIRQRREKLAQADELPIMKVSADLRRQFEAVLTPDQLASYKDMAIRNVDGFAVCDTLVLSLIDASDQQKSDLRQIRADFEAKHAQLVRETGEMKLKLLTPAQQEKLREDAN